MQVAGMVVWFAGMGAVQEYQRYVKFASESRTGTIADHVFDPTTPRVSELIPRLDWNAVTPDLVLDP